MPVDTELARHARPENPRDPAAEATAMCANRDSFALCGRTRAGAGARSRPG